MQSNVSQDVKCISNMTKILSHLQKNILYAHILLIFNGFTFKIVKVQWNRRSWPSVALCAWKVSFHIFANVCISFFTYTHCSQHFPQNMESQHSCTSRKKEYFYVCMCCNKRSDFDRTCITQKRGFDLKMFNVPWLQNKSILDADEFSSKHNKFRFCSGIFIDAKLFNLY